MMLIRNNCGVVTAIVIVLLLMPAAVYSAEPLDIVKNQIENFDFSSLEENLAKIQSGNYSEIFRPFSFKDTAVSIASGDFSWDAADIFNSVLRLFFHELLHSYGIVIRLIIIALLASLISNLQKSFDKEGAGEAAFYACFCLIAAMGIRVFISGAAILSETVDNTVAFMAGLIPILMTLLATGGRPASAAALNPAFFAAIGIFTVTIKNFILPLIYMMTAVKITDILVPDMSLGKLSELFGTIIKWTVGTMLTIFVGMIGIYGIAAPAIDNITVKTAKFAVGSMVPIVGSILSDSVELVLSSAAIIKKAAGISGLIAICLIIAYPALKLLAQCAVMYITAAVIQPISDKRISELISCIAKSLGMILSMLITLTVMMFILICFVIV